MTERLLIGGFVRFLGEQLDERAGYIMGSLGQNPRTGYHDLSVTKCKPAWEPNGWYFNQYTDPGQRAKALYWREHCKRVFDCQGLSEGYYEIVTGKSVNTYARMNYQTWCDPKGSGLIPAAYRVPGAAVFWGTTAASIHHVGYLYRPVKEGQPEEDWYIIEARGVKYGVVMTRLSERKPNYWGWMTRYFDYGGAQAVSPERRALRNGSDGEDVKALQTILVELGYDLGRWGCDGDFGDCTEMAVKVFQREHQLTADGVVGEKTWTALDQAMAREAAPVDNPKKVLISGGSCFVRDQPNTSGKVRGAVVNGTILEFGGEIDEETKWLSVVYRGEKAWVSGKYGRLMG